MLTTLTPNDRVKLKNKFDEISNSYTRIEAERELIKEILSDIKEQFEIAPKVSRKLAKIRHKRNLQEVVAESQEVEETYTDIFA
jgi:hypothetical protein